MDTPRTMRARPARALLTIFASSASLWAGSTQAQSDPTALLEGAVVLRQSANASPYDVVDDVIEHNACDAKEAGKCTAYTLFVSEIPNSAPADTRRGAPAAKAKAPITYNLTVINGGIQPLKSFRVAALKRPGMNCRETDFLEMTGDFRPRGPFTLGDLLDGNVVIENLGPNQMSAMAFTCEVN